MSKMKKLLFLFDTDSYASVFDTVVAYDGGADRVTGYANVTPDNAGALVDGGGTPRSTRTQKRSWTSPASQRSTVSHPHAIALAGSVRHSW